MEKWKIITILLQKQLILYYSVFCEICKVLKIKTTRWCHWQDLNLRPTDYEFIFQTTQNPQLSTHFPLFTTLKPTKKQTHFFLYFQHFTFSIFFYGTVFDTVFDTNFTSFILYFSSIFILSYSFFINQSSNNSTKKLSFVNLA